MIMIMIIYSLLMSTKTFSPSSNIKLRCYPTCSNEGKNSTAILLLWKEEALYECKGNQKIDNTDKYAYEYKLKIDNDSALSIHLSRCIRGR